jgi:hypothetical protein
MSDSKIIPNFKTALMTKFTAVDGVGSHNTFYTAIQGRLYEGRAQGTDYPYSVYEIIDQTPDKTFSDDYRNLLIQFSHYSDDRYDSSECDLINAYCNDLFDECAAFSITGATLLWMRLTTSPGAKPEMDTKPDGTESGWVAFTDFEADVKMT